MMLPFPLPSVAAHFRSTYFRSTFHADSSRTDAEATVPSASLALPFVDLARFHTWFDTHRPGAIPLALTRVHTSGCFLRGAEVTAFEAEFATYCGTRNMVCVGNGTDALQLALQAGGAMPGDEVIVPAFTFIATWNAVSLAGCIPVPADVCPDTGTLDLADVRTKLTPRTTAIIPVHLYGRCAAMADLSALAKKRGLLLIEDAAQAHGARYQGKRAGSLAHAAAFSFYPTKNLGALGDGGAIATDDPVFAERARRLANYGALEKHDHELVGGNSRLDEIQAAILREKLTFLEECNAQRRRLAAVYHDALSDFVTAGLLQIPLPNGTAPQREKRKTARNTAGSTPKAEIPATTKKNNKDTNGPDTLPAWHLYVVRVANREKIAAALASAGVGTGVHYPCPPHCTPAYAELGWKKGSLPVAERLAQEVLSLPMMPYLEEAEVRRVAETLGQALLAKN